MILIIWQICRESNQYGPSATLTHMENEDAVTEEEFIKAAAARNPVVAIRCREIFAEHCDIPPDDRRSKARLNSYDHKEFNSHFKFEISDLKYHVQPTRQRKTQWSGKPALLY
jgi:hypothetical protein